MPDVEPVANGLLDSDEWRLDELWVNPVRGEITGPGGTEQVDPKVMAVLKVLAGNPGELVSRNHLLERIWIGGAIYDDVLTQCVYQLRRHLAAAGGGNRYRNLIKTLPKRGYLLKAEVTMMSGTAVHTADSIARNAGSPRQESSRQFFSKFLLLLVLPGLLAALWWWSRDIPLSENGTLARSELPVNRIAVLPFENAGGQTAKDYLIEGVSDDLRDRIASSGVMEVVARRSSIALKGSRQDVREVGRQLGVGRILEGRFELDQGRFVVTVELVDTNSGFRLWSDSYERSSQDLLLIQRSLEADVLTQLIPGFVDNRTDPQYSGQQMAAKDLILLGRQNEQQLTDAQQVNEAALAKAIDLYRQALAIDPDSAEAMARLARLMLYQGRVVEAEPLILRALEIDPQRSETFTTLGIYYWAIRSVGIGAAFQRAIELNPSNAEALASYASWAWVQGDVAEAESYYRAALEMDPLNLVRYAELGYKLAFQGSRIEAQQVLDRMQHMFPTVPGYLAAVRITEAMGDLDEAIAWALLAHEQEPGNADINGQLAELLARVGEFEMAQFFEPEPGMGQLFWQRRYQELADLGELQSIDFPGDLDISFTRAFALSALGKHQSAVDLLEAAGLPGTAEHESRRANELHAMYTYISALHAAGRSAEAESRAKSHIAFNEKFLRAGASDGWVPLLAGACSNAVINDEESALQLLEDMVKVDGIPRLPWLLDLACFDDYDNKPRYEAAVATVEARITTARERIPAALARHGLPPLTEIALAEVGPQP